MTRCVVCGNRYAYCACATAALFIGFTRCVVCGNRHEYCSCGAAPNWWLTARLGDAPVPMTVGFYYPPALPPL